ncbi:hypothetical protein XA3_15370 [Xylocopilactobacillus apicola]|uniref:Uncharacterized protein n=1 Tax=Xylocopilactobacillus apicola TaxID=2932184 RepID=A0AAU9D9K5_9LACO|nr:hypothetical protein XA3_15370 [Xylocopilactobacillus apicola]
MFLLVSSGKLKGKTIKIIKGTANLNYSIYVLEGFIIFFSAILLTGSFIGSFKKMTRLQKFCLFLVFICSLLPFITGMLPLIKKFL